MPVLRQKRTVTNAPIGVARINTGEAELWETIRANAKNVASTAFTNLKKESLNEAQELALNEDIDKVRTINPTTGKLEALELYNMNSDARVAYKRIIDSRFEKSISDEIQLKSKEFALINKISPQEYEKKFSQYLAGMVNNAPDGMYKGMIEEAGTFYLASTKMNLTETRRKEALIEHADFISSEINKNIETLSIATNQDEAKVILEKNIALLEDGRASGAYSRVKTDEGIEALNYAYYKGIIKTGLDFGLKIGVDDKETILENINGILTGQGIESYLNENYNPSSIPDKFRRNLAAYAQTYSSALELDTLKMQKSSLNLFAKKFGTLINESQDSLGNALSGKMTVPTDGEISAEKWVPNDAKELKILLNGYEEEKKEALEYRQKRLASDRFTDLGNVETVFDVNNDTALMNTVNYTLATVTDDTATIVSALSSPNNFPPNKDGTSASKELQVLANFLHRNKDIYPVNKISKIREYIKGGINNQFETAQQVKLDAIKKEKTRRTKLFHAVSATDFINQMDVNPNSVTTKDYINFSTDWLTKAVELGVSTPNFQKARHNLSLAFQKKISKNLLSNPQLNSKHVLDIIQYVETGGGNKNTLSKYNINTETEDGDPLVINHLMDALDNVLSYGSSSTHENLAKYFAQINVGKTKDEAEQREIIKLEIEQFELTSSSAVRNPTGFDKHFDWADENNWSTLMNTGSEQFSNTVNEFLNGGVYNPKFERVQEIFNTFSNVKDPRTGNTISVLKSKGILNDKQIAFLQTVSDVSRLRGSAFTADIVQNLGNKSTQELNEGLSSFFSSIDNKEISEVGLEKAVKEFIELSTSDDSYDPTLYKQYKDYLTYMVATGFNEATIAANLSQIHNKEFVEDETFIDPRFANNFNKTNLGFSTIFPDENRRKWVESNIETTLNKYGYSLNIGEGEIIREESQEYFVKRKESKAGTERVFLVPDKTSSGEGINWWPHKVVGGELVPLIVEDDNGIIMPGFNEKELREDFTASEASSSLSDYQIEQDRKFKIAHEKLNYLERVEIAKELDSFVSGESVDESIISNIKEEDTYTFSVGERENKRTYKYVKNSGIGTHAILNSNNEVMQEVALHRILGQLKGVNQEAYYKVFDTVMDTYK